MTNKLLAHRWLCALVAGSVLTLLTTTMAIGGLALANAWGWGTNVGWINLDAPPEPVIVCADHLEGYAWGENIGWIRFDPDFGAAGPPPQPPTAARVTRFAAHPTRGGNLVRWETATEVDVSGFNVFRAADPTGLWLRVNDALIPATGSAAVWPAGDPDMYAWFIDLRDRLPVIAVSLRPPDEDLPLDLQHALDLAYDRAGYADLAGYDAP